jgi:hypothetical protein
MSTFLNPAEFDRFMTMVSGLQRVLRAALRRAIEAFEFAATLWRQRRHQRPMVGTRRVARSRSRFHSGEQPTKPDSLNLIEEERPQRRVTLRV